MEVIAIQKGVRVSTRKVRLIAEIVRNKPVQQAINTLSLLQKRGALDLLKTIKSAVANASHNAKLSSDNLVIKRIDISEGQALKRYHPSTRGRVHPYKKRASHIRIVLGERSTDGAKN